MQAIRMLKKSDADGSLSLHIPLGQPETEFEVVVVVQAKTATTSPTDKDRGWPPGYFEKTLGSIDDATFVRPRKANCPSRWSSIDDSSRYQRVGYIPVRQKSANPAPFGRIPSA